MVTRRRGPVWARFDDVIVGTALEFPAITHELVAWHPDEVVRVLDEVEDRAARGRWVFGHVTYEAASGLDPGLATHDAVPGLPLAWFGVATECRRVPVVAPRVAGATPDQSWSLDWDEATYGAAVRAVHAKIAAGETYQCNLTTRLRGAMPSDVLELYQNLALGQRGRYNAYLDTGRFAIASASPELFFDQRDERILMRPMKGTSPRGRTTAEDDASRERLLSSEKERAENVMIVDLVRNDLARVAEPGTVQVDRLLHAERYETVHQLTSDVTATLRPDVGLAEIFRALFPCGSITGAPKARTMELIKEVESGPRGVYCGAIGYVAPGRRARFSVAIRTAVVDRAAGTAVYGTGGGITWSSTASAEYVELQVKTRVLDARPQVFHLEAMRFDADRGGLRSLDAHLARAADSADYFGFRFDETAARAALEADLAGERHAIALLRCYRDGTVRVEVEQPAPGVSGPVRLGVDREPIPTGERWTQHTTSVRDAYTSRLARHAGADDVVVVNERLEIMGSCRANLAVCLDRTWWTPPAESGCLPGVERARLLKAGHLRERRLDLVDLVEAKGIALISSAHGWRNAVLEEASVRGEVRAQ